MIPASVVCTSTNVSRPSATVAEAAGLDRVGQQAPAAGVGPFARLPGDAGRVHHEGGQRAVGQAEPPLGAEDRALLQRTPDHGPRDRLGQDRLLLHDGHPRDVGDRLGALAGPSGRRHLEAGHRRGRDHHPRHLDRRDRGGQRPAEAVREHVAGEHHAQARRHLHHLRLERPVPHEGEHVDHAVAAGRVEPAGGPGLVRGTGAEVGLPAGDGGEVAGGVVVVAMGGLAEDAPQVGRQGHLLVAGLGVRAVGAAGGRDDPVLLGDHLQAVGLGVVAVLHEVRQRQHRPHEHLLVIRARVGAGRVVGQQDAGRLAGVRLLQVVEPVANLPQHPLGLRGPPVGEGHHRPVEGEHVGVVAVAGQTLAEQPVGGGQVAPLEGRPHVVHPPAVRHAAGHGEGEHEQGERTHAGRHSGRAAAGDGPAAKWITAARADSWPASGSDGYGDSPC